MRPLCVMLGARMGGQDMDQQVRQIAIASELVRTATLLHDVIDQGAGGAGYLQPGWSTEMRRVSSAVTTSSSCPSAC